MVSNGQVVFIERSLGLGHGNDVILCHSEMEKARSIIVDSLHMEVSRDDCKIKF